jgi:ADP-ribosyl-[dinitrogen reductase] hydrolase
MKGKKLILGAIIGDVIGSVYEWNNVKTTDFELFSKATDFTDDSVLTFATMDSILNGIDYSKSYQYYGRRFPHRGYGGNFQYWIHQKNPQPYNSWGNGSAMRVSPVGWAYNTLDEVLHEAERSASVTHNHPEGIKGAQATASAVFLARTGHSKREIKTFIEDRFSYDLERHLDEIRKTYVFDVSCQGSVPEAIMAFLESNDFEHAIRLAISIGGDSDTIACITGGISEAFYKEVPDFIIDILLGIIPNELVDLVKKFSAKYGNQ